VPVHSAEHGRGREQLEGAAHWKTLVGAMPKSARGESVEHCDSEAPAALVLSPRDIFGQRIGQTLDGERPIGAATDGISNDGSASSGGKSTPRDLQTHVLFALSRNAPA
jgi:hypothetical protein